MKSALGVRPSSIAGQWYPSDPTHLAAQVDEYIRSAHLPEISGEVVAVMVPHAGHRYSGSVAGYAFAALCGLEVDLVAIVSPMHYPYEEPILSTAHTAYATPLGEIPVDRHALVELDACLRERLGFGLAHVIRDPEHSLEIELPFLQRSLSGPFRLLPVMLREHHPTLVETLGHALAHLLRSHSAILVASSDLSHFFPQQIANMLDQGFLQRVEAFDPAGVLLAEDEGVGFACGRGAVAAVLWAASDLGADQVKVVKYATSGDVTGDYGQVVGYGSAIVLRSRPTPDKNE